MTRRDPTRVSWQDFDRANAHLADQIRAAAVPIDTILAIARGGAVSGVALAHALGIRDFFTITVRTTLSDHPNADRSTPVTQATEHLPPLAGRNVLLIDDVTGTGTTLAIARRLLAPLGLAALHTAVTFWNLEEAGPGAICPANFHGATTPSWVIFPWEQDPA